MTGMAKSTLAWFVVLACGPLSAETLYLWQGEKTYVWRDVTNSSPNLVVMKPSSPDAFVRTGVALPVRMENDRLVNDRVVWGGSAAVPPGGDEEKRALAEGKRVISLANQSSPRNIQLGWWYMTEQMGAALMNCGWLKHVPHNGYFNELFFRIGRTGLKLPVEGFSQKDFVMVGEGGEACYLYLARRRLPNGARHYLIAGLDVTSDTPEGAALLHGAVEDIDRVSYAVSDFGKSADMFSASPRVFSQRNGDYRDGSHPITDGLVTFDLKNEYSLSIDNEIPVWGKPLEYGLGGILRRRHSDRRD